MIPDRRAAVLDKGARVFSIPIIFCLVRWERSTRRYVPRCAALCAYAAGRVLPRNDSNLPEGNPLHASLTFRIIERNVSVAAKRYGAFNLDND